MHTNMASIQNFLSFFIVVFLRFCRIECTTPYEEIIQYKDEYTLPELPYSYDGLEPFIDEATLRVHHLGHHAAYTKKLNAALNSWRESVSSKERELKVAKLWIAFCAIIAVAKKLLDSVKYTYCRGPGGGGGVLRYIGDGDVQMRRNC